MIDTASCDEDSELQTASLGQIHSRQLITRSLKWITFSHVGGGGCREGGGTIARSHHCLAGRLHSTGLLPTLAEVPQVSAMLRRSPSCVLCPLLFQRDAMAYTVLLQMFHHQPPWGSQAPQSRISKASGPWQEMAFHVKSRRLNLFKKGSLWSLKKWNLFALCYGNKKLKRSVLEDPLTWNF